MANILIIVSNIEFDPTEACVPWSVLTGAGHDVWFASEEGGAPVCDVITLTGEGLPKHLQSLAARPANREVYQAMAKDKRFINALAWKDVAPDDFDALVLPGGHAPGVKPYLESGDVFRICRNFFERKAPVSSVCHGVLALSRAKDEGGRSLLYGYKVTGLTNFLEKTAIKMTRKHMGGHYQTYPETVQDEVCRALKSKGDFKSGPAIPAYGTAKNSNKGFVVTDGHLVSGRWPGDCYKLAHALLAQLDAVK